MKCLGLTATELAHMRWERRYEQVLRLIHNEGGGPLIAGQLWMNKLINATTCSCFWTFIVKWGIMYRNKRAARLSAFICHVPPCSSQLVACFLLFTAELHFTFTFSLLVCSPVICFCSFFFFFPETTQSTFTGFNVQSRTRQQQTLATEREGCLISVAGFVLGSGGSASLTARRLTVEIFPRRSSVGQHERWSEAPVVAG